MSTDNTTRHGPGRWVLGFFIVVSTLAGFGFIYKLYEFFFELTGTEGFSFAGVHLITYVLVALGFVALLAHAFLRGHFSDIEQPKYDLLAHERAFDLGEYEDDGKEAS